MLVFILPMILILSLISYMNNKRERMELESLTETNALQLADVMLGSLNHAMMMNDKGMLSSVLGEIGKNPSIEEVSIVASDATVFISTDLSKIGLKLDLKDVGCIDVLHIPWRRRPRVHAFAAGQGIFACIHVDSQCPTVPGMPFRVQRSSWRFYN